MSMVNPYIKSTLYRTQLPDFEKNNMKYDIIEYTDFFELILKFYFSLSRLLIGLHSSLISNNLVLLRLQSYDSHQTLQTYQMLKMRHFSNS